MRALDHTHQDGRVWLVLEDFGGRSLAELYANTRPTIPEAIDLAIRVVQALAEIHDRDIVHKNLGPSTILVNPDTGELKLFDFSIASTVARERTLQRSDPSGFANLLYMAPEQSGRMNRVVDYRSDYYALGAVLYELLCGRPPFLSGDPLDLVHAHTARQPTPPVMLRPEIPNALSDLVLTLLAKRAEHRYQSAAGLLHDLGLCLRLATGESEASFSPKAMDVESRFRIPEVLYGRDAEVTLLEQACERAAQGAIEVLLVAGEPGIGKTTLVQEVQRPATRLGAHLIAGKFDQVNRGLPYASLVQAIRQFIRHILAGSPEQVAAWSERLNDAVSGAGRVLTNLIGDLELVMGEQPPLDDVSTTEAENRLRITFQRFVRALASPTAPLILFLDDLQWADLASLRLLESLALDPDASHILLLGAFRNNEVSPSGPLHRMQANVRMERFNIRTITLGPLDQGDAEELLADALQSEPDRVRALATAVMRKTHGNPFYLGRFLEELHNDGLLVFEECAWTWDLEEIQRRSVTENVVAFLARELGRLPQATQDVLHLAACVGVRFELHIVAELAGTSRTQCRADLQVALDRDLIHAVDEYYWPGEDEDAIPNFLYAFAHDRVQQAAHEALDDSARTRAHLAIGRLMRDRTGALQRTRRLFEMVEHFNQGAAQLTSVEERDQLADLNLLAGRRALESAAYAAAHRYLSRGIAQTSPESWTRRYGPTLELHVAAAEAANLAGEDEAMAAMVAAVTEHAASNLDRMRAEEIVVYGLIRRNELLSAVHKALDLLEELGAHLPRDPSQAHLEGKVGEVIGQLAELDVEALLRLPDLDDPNVEAARKLMNGVASAAYLTVPTLFPLIAIEQVQSTLRHGLSRESTYGFALVGLVLSSINQIPMAAAQAEVAQALLERWPERALRVRPTHVIYAMIQPWIGPIPDTWEPLLRNYADGVDTGDLEYGFWSAHQYTFHAYYGGLPLDRAETEFGGITRAMLHHKQLPQYEVNAPFVQLVANLRGHAEDPTRLVGPEFDEEAYLARHRESHYRGAVFVGTTCMLMVRTLFRDYEGAAAIAHFAREYSDSAPATIHCASIRFYGAQALLRLPDPDAEAMAQVREDYAALTAWAAHNPYSYQPWVTLLDAEIARVEGRVGDALTAYDAAIASARASGLLCEEALANERAGLFHLDRGSVTAGRAYLVEARYAYQRWGATEKLRQLAKAHPDLDLGVPAGRPEARVDVDQLSLVRASHALASELRLGPLVRRVIELGIQAAGATRGFLLTEQDGSWVIEVGLDADGQDIVPRETPLAGCAELATSVVQYVGRTQEPLVLADATEDPRFAQDPWLAQAATPSVLCTPLAHQGETRGILYLENHLLSGCFTPDRLENAQVLASQAAISMENAVLVDTLEAKVAERTAALRDFTSTVAHELRTPMTSVLGFVKLTTRTFEKRLQPQLGDDPKTKKAMDQVTRNLAIVTEEAERLTSLIGNMLDLAKIESGRMEWNRADLRPEDLVERACHACAGLFSDEGDVVLQKKLGPKLPAVHGDPDWLQQVLINLVSNAAKFTEHGTVTVSATRDEDDVVFQVADTGPGIAPEHLEQVFERFAQVGEQGARKGTGLGLPICKEIVSAHTGEIGCESTLGEGATFWFRLPAI